MKRLFLVRHGQASLLSKNYDQLSAKGFVQSRVLGEYWRRHGPRQPVEFFCGSLQRQQQTLAGLCGGWGIAGAEHATLEGLNEFPFEKLVERWLPQLCEQDGEVRAARQAATEAQSKRERYRAVQTMLELLMQRWRDDPADEQEFGVPRWSDFVDGAAQTVRDAIAGIDDKTATVVATTSGGVVAALTSQSLGAPAESAIAMSWQIKNASVTEFAITEGGLVLRLFNHVQHLPRELQTYR